jgi:hypothetical protein
VFGVVVLYRVSADTVTLEREEAAMTAKVPTQVGRSR